MPWDGPGTPGAVEPIDAAQPFLFIIDDACTPDSREKLYATLRRFTKGRVIAVFGSCGDRDRGKRPVMGEVGGRDADIYDEIARTPRTSRSTSPPVV